MYHLNWLLCAVLFVSTLMALMIAMYSIGRRNIPGCNYFMHLCLVISVYCFGYGMELLNQNYDKALFWNGVQYLAIPYICILGVFMAFEYTGNHIFIKHRNKLMLLFLIPFSVMVMRFTNPVHHLYYTSSNMVSNGFFMILKLEKGPFYYFYMLYITVFGIYASLIYLRSIIKSATMSRAPMTMMFIATLFPWVAAYLNMTNTAPFGIDYSAVTIALSLIIYMIGIFRFKMFKTIPIARDAVFYNAKEGILILDNNNLIIDFNHAACNMLDEPLKTSLSKEFRVLFPTWPMLGKDDNEGYHEFTTKREDGIHYLTCAHTILQQSDMERIGSIVTITDVTKHIEAQKQLELLATIDTLTGLFNRRFLYDRFTRELSHAERKGTAISVIMFDIDHFKRVNDKHGHLFGDEVLRQISHISKEEIRPTDTLSRYGGEEFLILLPETDPGTGVAIAERLRREIGNTIISWQGQSIHITASFGVSGIDAYMTGISPDLLIDKADEALYKAKKNGRNCVECMDINMKSVLPHVSDSAPTNMMG